MVVSLASVRHLNRRARGPADVLRSALRSASRAPQRASSSVGLGAAHEVEVYFLRHGISTWNMKAGPADIGAMMEKHGIGASAAADADVEPAAWRKAMAGCLHSPTNELMRENPRSAPPRSVAALDPFFTDPPLTLDGKRSLRDAMPKNASLFQPRQFDVVVVSPMLRTLQTAAIAAQHLPLAEDCQWVIDADAREENHAGWIDTWGTASFRELRTRARREIGAPDCAADKEACRLRLPMQARAIAASADEHVVRQAKILSKRPNGLLEFLRDVNRPAAATSADSEAALADAALWARVEARDPPFRYRAGGLPTSRVETSKYSAEDEVQWWADSESRADVRERVLSVLRSDAVCSSRGPVLIVTHSMFIDKAIRTLLTGSTRWAGPAEHPSVAQKLIANGGMFRAVVSLGDCTATEAAVSAWGSISLSLIM